MKEKLILNFKTDALNINYQSNTHTHKTRSGCLEGQLEESEFLTLYRLSLCVEVLNNFPSGDISFYDIQLYFMNLYSSRHSSASIFFIFIHASREMVG